MTILYSLLVDLLSTIQGYWHIWLYAIGMTGYYIYSLMGGKTNTQSKTSQPARLTTINNICANPSAAIQIAANPAILDNAQGDDQWRRLALIVETATRRDDNIARLHHKAGDQLGAAELGLNNLLSEIASIMPLPIEATRPARHLAPQMNRAAPAQALAA